MEIVEGGIYEFGQVFYLVLLKNEDNNREMVYCSYGQSENSLLNVKDFGLLTVNDNWKFIKKISNEQLEKSLLEFRNNYNVEIKENNR